MTRKNKALREFRDNFYVGINKQGLEKLCQRKQENMYVIDKKIKYFNRELQPILKVIK